MSASANPYRERRSRNAGGPLAAEQPPAPVLARLVLVAIVLVSLGLAVLPFRTRPEVVGASAPVDRFSAARAMPAVQAIAAAPHPIDSAAHAVVVDYLVGQLRQLGLSPEVQDDTGVLYDTDVDPSQVSAAHLQNIIARLPGTDSTGTVMLYGHYGSVPTSPNAADGAVGVAAVLETVRALRAGPPLRNDVLIVLADGDETPALGPHLFRRHTAAKDITVGIALEGLSNHGAVALAYAGQGTPNVPGSYSSAANGTWLRQALSVMPHRFTTLAVNDMQIASPELSIATKDAGAGGIGSLILGGGEVYHTVRDNPANLDVANVQAHGDNTLALARHFGTAALDRQPTEPELVAFTVPPNTVLSYPSTWAVGLLVLTVLVFLALMIIGFRRRVLTGWGVAIGLLITMLSLPIVLAVDVAAWLAVVAINPAYRAPMGRGYYGATWNLAFLTCLTLATVSALHVLARRYLRPARDDVSVAAGALIIPLLLAALTSFTFPAFSYVFAWPTLAAALLLGWRVLQPSITGRPWAYLAGVAVVMVITTIVVLAPVYLIYSAYAAPGSARVSPIYPVPGLVIVAAVVPVLLPHLHFIGGRRRWTVPAALVALAAVFLGTELIITRFDAGMPRPNYVQYTLNADTGQTSWLSPGEQPDGWTAQFFPDGYTKTTAAFSPGYYFEQQRTVIARTRPEDRAVTARAHRCGEQAAGRYQECPIARPISARRTVRPPRPNIAGRTDRGNRERQDGQRRRHTNQSTQEVHAALFRATATGCRGEPDHPRHRSHHRDAGGLLQRPTEAARGNCPAKASGVHARSVRLPRPHRRDPDRCLAMTSPGSRHLGPWPLLDGPTGCQH
jgi:Peptidase family M28